MCRKNQSCISESRGASSLDLWSGTALLVLITDAKANFLFESTVPNTGSYPRSR
jgi:hypothetical protein